MKKTLIIILSLLLVIVAVVGLYINNTRKLVKYAEKNNIKLLEIWYYDYNNIDEILNKEISV